MVIMSLVFTACVRDSDHNHNHEHADHNTSATKEYTCPMHPQVVQNAPGTCPVCGMALVEKATQTQVADIMLSDSQIKLANITTQKVSEQSIEQYAVVNGRLATNETQREVVSSRGAGRIEKLYVKETGVRIGKGEPLYTLYSENLLTLQRELIVAKKQYETLTGERYKSIYDAAKRKLTLYGLTEKQIAALEQTDHPEPRTTFVAPAAGIVTTLDVQEGQYVQEGNTLMTLDDLQSLWVETELYAGETDWLQPGEIVQVTVQGFTQPVPAEVTFLNPEFSAGKQIIVLRAVLNNRSQQYAPGMQAQIRLPRASGQNLSVPVDAVIRDQTGARIFVQRGNNTFRPVMVRTGIEDFDKVEITEGLHAGDTVAISGAYLLYSEYLLRNGGDVVAQQEHVHQ